MKIDLKEYLEFDSLGKLDLDATMLKFEVDATTYYEQIVQATQSIGEAMHKAFDKYPGARFNVPYLTNAIMTNLEVNPNNSTEMLEHVKAYLKHAKETGVIEITKGPKGCVTRKVKPTSDPIG